MQVFGRLVPVRFLALISHFVILVTMLWTVDSNVKACLHLGYSQADFDQQNTYLTLGFSLSIALFAFEMMTFLAGITMFIASVSLLSSLCHICASITLSLFVLEHWQCHDFWYIFGFCSALPAVCEFIAVLIFLLGKKR